MLPCLHQILHASRAAPSRCLRLLLACEGLHRTELPGRLPMRRLVQDLLEEHGGAAHADGASSGVVHTCEVVLGALTAA